MSRARPRAGGRRARRGLPFGAAAGASGARSLHQWFRADSRQGLPTRTGPEGRPYHRPRPAVDTARRAMLWEQRDVFAGEDEPPVTVDLPWPAATVTAVDALGGRPRARLRDGRLRLPLSLTPVYLTP